jgi:transcription antitermination factor NusG
VVDQRDEQTWVTVELTHLGEAKVVEGTIEASLRRDLGVDEDHPIFIPCALYQGDGRHTTIHLMEGYIFVASGLPETAYFRLEQQPYVAQVMSTQVRGSLRVLSVITDTHIREMKAKLREMVTSEIPVGAQVRIQEGTYRNLIGRVTGIDNGSAFVHIRLRSLEVVATVPRIFLESWLDPE